MKIKLHWLRIGFLFMPYTKNPIDFTSNQVIKNSLLNIQHS